MTRLFRPTALLTALFAPLLGCHSEQAAASHVSSSAGSASASSASAPTATSAAATFAGGCFWCMESPFEHLPGVHAVISGYTGGHVENPEYHDVGDGGTGHAEAIQVLYDPLAITYEDLLEVYWRQIDPTDAGGQFIDRGDQYRSEIFVHDAAQRAAAEASKQALAASGRYDAPIVTPITDLTTFWEAEEYHQDYHEKEPGNYQRYRRGSGRDRYLDRTWGEEREYEPKGGGLGAWRAFVMPTEQELRARLTELQFRVTREDATERPFKNEYWDNHAEGLYVDVVSGEPLFSSRDKFDSGTGWPSFTRPIDSERVKLGTDYKLGYARGEVRSALGDSHLGHVFDDGPEPTGQRWCMNSAAMRFIPVERLAEEGYPELAPLFEEPE